MTAPTCRLFWLHFSACAAPFSQPNPKISAQRRLNFGLDGNSVPQVYYLTCVRDVDLLEAHRFSAGVFEQAGAVAEKHRCYRHQHLVEHTGRKELRGDTGAKDVDVLVARSDARFGDGRFDVANERHTRPTLIRWSMRQDNLWAVPAAAEHLSLALLALVGIVAAEGPVAHEDRTRLSDQ